MAKQGSRASHLHQEDCRPIAQQLIVRSMPRPKQIPARPPLTVAQIEMASYVGSPEHKVHRYWAGLPQAWVGSDGVARRPNRQQTTVCHLTSEAEREQACAWVQAALTLGQVRYYDGDGTFPKHIWYRDSDGQYWFGFAVNQTAGTYKGWPITKGEKLEIFN
jgi:hypothetical protein